ncbi:hypothetical protein TSUD_302080 [Trifolium subterraneum]|uniref:Uncharacterized protein n=1 Tax=Trifolium subterraneum TaxID=3900 RepID=A0A2Z6PBN8_TRISU|nr:hypothetical protein TSUD_302080 [Trifolium subterraneum]
MVILQELSDSGEPLETPHLGSRLERQIRSHYTRADGSLNDRGYISELLGFPVNSSDEESSLDSDSDSSWMETPSKYNSVESVRCFREVVKLYDGGDDAEVIVDPVGEGEFITTVNVGEPHYFYMCGPKLPDLMYDSERKPLFPFYWSDDPRVIRGVDDSLLTPFERETVDFLDTFCLLDIKDVIRREKNPQGLVSFLKNMRRVPEEEWLSFLAKSKQKRLAPDASVDPLTQVIVDDGAPKGVKRKKRAETVKGPVKIPKGNEGSSSAVGEPEQQVEGGAGLLEPPKKPGYKLRSSGTSKDAGVGNSDDEAPPTAWGSDFDPSTFLDDHLAMKGDATKFNSMGIAELRKLALGHELKGAVLSNLLSQRQERETKEANERADRLAKTAEDVEQRYETAKLKLKEEVASLKKAHKADLEKAKKDYDDACQKLAADNEKRVKALNEEVARNCGRVDDLISSRNQNLVALCLAKRQIAELEGEIEELEEDNSSLKETLADKYIDGFLLLWNK